MAKSMLGVVVLCIASAMACTGHAADPPASDLHADETVIVFPSRVVRETAAAAAKQGEPAWVIRLRGWVFEREEDSSWRNAAIDKLGEQMGLTEREIEGELFRSRARSFLCDNERGKRVEVRIGKQTYVMPETSEDGHFEGEIRLSDAELKSAIVKGGKGGESQRVELTIENAKGAAVDAAAVRVVGSKGLLVVCDIDDTIKVSNIGDHTKVLRATFVEPFAAVPGMSELLGKLAAAGEERVEFHYLSASPWQLYEPLAAFLRDNGFPEGCITLREFRMKDERVLTMFKDPREYKRAEIEGLMSELPDRKLVLIGDSTEHDAELYAEVARAHPGRVQAILIRATPGDEAGQERARLALESLPEGTRGAVFEDPAGVAVHEAEVSSPPAP